jgi:hypothetical protein
LNLLRWPFVTLKRSDGERVYVRTHSEEYETIQLAEINLMNTHVDGLLGDSKEIWDAANEMVSSIKISL